MMKKQFMQAAMEEARKAMAIDEVPIGAVIVWNNEIIARAHNRVEEFYDPTAHAEMLAIQEACEKLGAPRIPECEIYVTLEPCAMCATAISFARLKRLYYGAADPKMGGIHVFSTPSCHHRPEIYDGINATESLELIKSFFMAKR